jgi:hypothetical protein
MAKTLAGRCYCGAVHYAVADEFTYAMNCHCAGCRRTTSAAFKSFAGIERGKFIVTQGRDKLLVHGRDVEKAHNAHCGTCGSFLYSLVRDGQYIHVSLGSLADEPTIRPTHHIFVGSKAPWFTITDDLPQYEGHLTR